MKPATPIAICLTLTGCLVVAACWVQELSTKNRLLREELQLYTVWYETNFFGIVAKHTVTKSGETITNVTAPSKP